VAFAGVHLRRHDVEIAAVGRELRRGNLPPARGELARRGRGRRHVERV